MLRRLTFGLAAIEAVVLLGFLLQYLSDPPGAAGSGGPQIALFFFVLAPGLVLAVATALLVLGRAGRRGGAARASGARPGALLERIVP